MINIRCHVMGDIHRLNFNWNSLCDPRCLILLIFFAQEKCDDNNYNYNNNRRNNNGNNNHEINLLLIFTIFRLLDAWNIYLICRDFRIQAIPCWIVWWAELLFCDTRNCPLCISPNLVQARWIIFVIIVVLLQAINTEFSSSALKPCACESFKKATCCIANLLKLSMGLYEFLIFYV